MLIGAITLFSLLLAAVVCGAAGGFAGFGWLWMLPAGFAGLFLILLAVAALFLAAACKAVRLDVPQEHDSKFYRVLANLYAEALIWIAGLHVKTEGLEKTPKEGRFLVVSNHLNEADPGVLLHYFRKSQLAFISKQENANMLVVGKVMHKIMCQLVNRENDREALKTILKCIELLKRDEVSIAVFPEGGIKGGNTLHPFRHGVFKIAQKANVPIVVCTIQGTGELFRNMKKLKPTYAQFHLVGVIPAEELKGQTSVQIGERVYSMMIGDLGPDFLPKEQNT